MDFKTKNSNWSHFEGYESPVKEENTDDGEDFPWSDPPNNTTPVLQQTPQRQNIPNSTQSNNPNNQQLPKPVFHRRASSTETIRNYNASIMPNKLILMRHGQSEGNVDEVLYSTKPDNNMRLTQLGWESAQMAGRALKEEIGEGETVHFVVSPYVRTVETFHGVLSAWIDPFEFDGMEGGRNRRLKAWYSKLMEMGEWKMYHHIMTTNEYVHTQHTHILNNSQTTTLYRLVMARRSEDTRTRFWQLSRSRDNTQM